MDDGAVATKTMRSDGHDDEGFASTRPPSLTSAATTGKTAAKLEKIKAIATDNQDGTAGLRRTPRFLSPKGATRPPSLGLSVAQITPEAVPAPLALAMPQMQTIAGSRRRGRSFAEITYALIQSLSRDMPALIRWSPDGRMFYTNTANLARIGNAIKPFFSRTYDNWLFGLPPGAQIYLTSLPFLFFDFQFSLDGNYASFRRQLSAYAFRRVQDPK